MKETKEKNVGRKLGYLIETNRLFVMMMMMRIFFIMIPYCYHRIRRKRRPYSGKCTKNFRESLNFFLART